MVRPYILALDLGTTGNRAIVFDRKQRIVSQVYEEFPQIYPKPGWVEHDPLAIWESTKRIIFKTFKKISAERIASMGIANQRETVLLWDKRTGRPIHNAIVWQCRRTAAFCEDLKKKRLEKFIHQRTGLFLDAYFSASKIHWLLQNVKGARSSAAKGRLLAGTIDSWVIWKLSGGTLHVTDTSNASRTMLFNIHKKAWDQKLCDIFKVPMKILPKVVPSSVGAISARADRLESPLRSFEIPVLDKKLFGHEIPITGIVGDQQGASFAQGCFKPGIIKNTYGTGLFMLENTGKKPKFSKNLLTTVAWSIGHLKNTEYAIEGSVFIGGAAIQWLRDELKILKTAKESEKISKSISSNEGVYFVPALVGLGAPHWDSHARGTILGITRGTGRAHLVRAALESIVYQTRDVLGVLKKDTHAAIKILRVDGGASANNFLMQFQADILGIPVERPKIMETTALGAAGLAGIAVGFWKNRDEFNRLRRVDRVFYPRMRRSKADALYARWKIAVERSRDWDL